jgi:hypothetical protein
MGSSKKIKTKKWAQSEYNILRNDIPKWYQVFLTKLNSPVTFWLCVFLVLFFYLQKQLAFHFYYIEQEQLFLWSRDYWTSVMMEPAGLARLLTEFCVQFFNRPYCGALIMSALFTLIGLLTAGIIKRIAPKANLFLISLLPIVLLLYIHFATNYFYRGTMAYMLMLLVMYGNFRIAHLTIRVIYVTVMGIILFWSAGGVAFLFVICVFLWELISRFSRAYGFIIPLLVVSGLSIWSVYALYVGDYRFVLLPDGYFTYQLRPGMDIYFPWIYMLLLLPVCRLLRHRENIKMGRKLVERGIQLILIAIAFWYGVDKFANRNSDFYKELDYYMTNGQWDKIIERCSGETTNYLYKCCLNVALAEKGELSERMFSFDQKGVQSIYVLWNRSPHISVLLSDIYFSMGHIAMAQRMAFEANESMPYAGSPRMLKRLIQTNLLFGFYQVAEKYIDLLEQTKYYKEWAHEQRRFLWNDEAIANDSLLNIKRMCIPVSNVLSEKQGLHLDLEMIARQNPAHKASIQYAGAFYLLSKDITTFNDLVERFYGTDVLPVLPKSYQEAIVLLYQMEPLRLEEYGVSPSVIQRFNELKRQIQNSNSNTATLSGLLKKNYGDTYWYYYMFKQ